MQTEDEKIIIDVLNGDSDAFSLLVHKYVTAVYSFVLHLSGLQEEANDITQETFLKVWKRLSTYKQGESFKAWLFTIARNTTIDVMRKRKDLVFSDFENGEGDNVLLDTLEDVEPLPDEVAIKLEEGDQLQKLLLTLRPLYREILLLHYKDNLTFEEISSVLKKPMNTVKSHHRRALMELRESTIKK